MRSTDISLRPVISLVFRRPKLLVKVSLAGIAASFLFSFLLFTSYTATARIWVVSSQTKEGSGYEGQKVLPTKTLVSTAIATKNRYLLQEVADRLDLQNAFGKSAVDKLARMIKLKPVFGSDIIDIAASAKTPELAAQIANAAAEIIVSGNVKEQFAFEKDVLNWVSEQVRGLRKELEDAAARLREFTGKTDPSLLKARLDTAAANLTESQRDLVKTRDQAQMAESAYIAMRNHLREDRKPEELLRSTGDQAYRELESEQLILDIEVKALLKKYQPDHPEIVEKTKKLEEVKAQMAARVTDFVNSIEGQFTGLGKKEKELAARIDETSKAIAADEEALDKYASLLNDLKEKDAMYTSFMKNIDKEFSSGPRGQKFVLIEQAFLPQQKARPALPSVIITGIVLGLLFSAAYNIIVDKKPLPAGAGARQAAAKKQETAQAKTGEHKEQKAKGMYIERVHEEENKEEPGA